MCIAIPGRIESIEGMRAKVSFTGNTVDVNLGIVSANVGDYVLVHAGCAIEVMKADKAEELLSLFSEIDELEQDGVLGNGNR